MTAASDDVLPTARAHAFVEDLDAPELDHGDRHHLERALRLAPGEVVSVADGAGRWRLCRFGPALEPIAAIVVDAAPRPAVGVAFAVMKGDRPEWTVQKLTELGVDLIVPFHAARSVVRWSNERAVRNEERLRRIAREAAMQSRRSRLPEVAPISSFADVARRTGALLADPGGRPPASGDTLLLVGPEGGWDDTERSVGLTPVGLGPTVLRAETAAVAAGVLLTALRPGGILGGRI